MSIPFDPREFVAERLQIDDEAERTLFVERCKAFARRAERVFVYATLVMTFLLVGTMTVRTAIYAYHCFTASPAPRSPAPQAIASPPNTVVEAGRVPTGQVR